MTDRTIVNSFIACFNPGLLISNSIKWQREKQSYMRERLADVYTALDQKLTRIERTSLTIERNELEKKIIFDDPAMIKNDDFDQWWKDNGYTINENMSDNVNRSMVKTVLNELLNTGEYKMVLTSRGSTSGCMFVMDSLQYAVWRFRNLPKSIQISMETKAEQAKTALDQAKNDHDLPDHMTKRLVDCADNYVDRSLADTVERKRIGQILDENQSVIAAGESKAIIYEPIPTTTKEN
jgi:uncharacterized protein (DUF2132 family)